MSDPQALVRLCQGRKIYIQTHNFPDPDAISSAFGLKKLLAHFGIESVLCHEGSIDKLSSVKLLKYCNIEIHPYCELKDTMKEEDYIVLVDCQKESGNTTDLIGDEVAAIDHHPTVVPIEYKYSDLRITGSCCSIIANYFKVSGIEPDAQTATALLYGLRMDTLQFSRGVTSFDIEMYGYLNTFVDSNLLTELETNNMEFSDLKAYDIAINNIQVYGKVGFSYLNIPCPDALVATLSEFILSLVEVEVAIVYAIRDNGYKFSIRSERSDVHSGDLARKALSAYGNGGGHATMAGGFAPKEKLLKEGEDVYTTVREIVMNVLEEDYPQSLK